MVKKTDEKKEAKMMPDPSIMPGPFPPPPPPIEHTVVYKYYIGDYVQVRNIGFTGIITALGVNQTEGNICLVDNGADVKWYAENLLEHVYYYKDPGEGPYPEPYNAGESSVAKEDE